MDDGTAEGVKGGHQRRGFRLLSQNADLRPFQRRFLAGATAPGIDTAALSLPRANGKSTLGAYLVRRILTPSDPLFRHGTESVLCAANLVQARIVFRIARASLEESAGDEYSFRDSANQIGIRHKKTGTGIRLVGSNGKGLMGLVNTPWAICDEPGAWETIGGELVRDAIETAKGKPGSPLRSMYLGTLAPAMSGWWHEMVRRGSHGSTYVQALQGDPERWDDWREIKRVNPLTAVSASFRAKLKEERDEALADSRLKARFLSYRLNVPAGDASSMLLDVADWDRTLARPVAPRSGRPIVAIDLGSGRAWSAAVANWPNGRVEAVACAPGIPTVVEQEKRDRVPRGTYAHLVQNGTLLLADGLRVPPARMLYNAIVERWGQPEVVTCDRFRLLELQDACDVPVLPRVSQWKESSEDIRAVRKAAMDGPMSVAEDSRDLLTASLAQCNVKCDESGNFKIQKLGNNNCARDDVASALTLAMGLRSRAPEPRKVVYHGLV